MILEKEKGLKLRKLRIIQLIEVDLQIFVRVFINDRNKDNIKNNERISKVNNRLCRGYLIDNLILEK